MQEADRMHSMPPTNTPVDTIADAATELNRAGKAVQS
jgi:hypothetical protein